MKKTKGFTLVELLGVIAIIATILVFTVPSIVGMLKRDEEKEYNRFLKDIYLATESYVQTHSEKYPNLEITSGSYTISMEELIQNGYIKTSVINPRTNQKISTLDRIKITKKADGGYDFEYIKG